MAETTTLPEIYIEARNAAVEAAWQAARLIRSHAGRLTDDAIELKGVHDLVTVVDREAQATIIKVLNKAFPSFDVLAEEDPEATAVDEAADGYRWIIDPIDGTTNFTHGLPPYAVSIGLQHGERIVAGVVLEVAHGELFTAVRGGGAYRNGRRIHVSITTSLDQSLLTTGFPYRVFEYVDAYLDVFRQFIQAARGVRRPGVASIDLAYVACGRFDGFFETGLSAWDMAAGMLLVEEAGGRVTDYHGQPHQLFGRQILASNGRIHSAMLDIVRPMRDIRL